MLVPHVSLGPLFIDNLFPVDVLFLLVVLLFDVVAARVLTAGIIGSRDRGEFLIAAVAPVVIPVAVVNGGERCLVDFIDVTSRAIEGGSDTEILRAQATPPGSFAFMSWRATCRGRWDEETWLIYDPQ